MLSHSFLLPFAKSILLMITSYQLFSIYLSCAATDGESESRGSRAAPALAHGLAGQELAKNRQRQWPE